MQHGAASKPAAGLQMFLPHGTELLPPAPPPPLPAFEGVVLPELLSPPQALPKPAASASSAMPIILVFIRRLPRYQWSMPFSFDAPFVEEAVVRYESGANS
jgi:hypothetical protein